MEQLTKDDYLKVADQLTAINPRWQKQVKKWGQAMRLVDYWVDEGFRAEELGFERAHRIALANEEKYFDRVQEIEFSLPKREIANAVRQLNNKLTTQFVDDLGAGEAWSYNHLTVTQL
jgi:hypothetical protein